MILIDANLLLYAYDTASDNQAEAKRWLEEILSRPEQIRLPWVTILAFLRLSTSARAFRHPLSAKEALAIVSEWLSRHSVVRKARILGRASGRESPLKRPARRRRSRCGSSRARERELEKQSNA